jgi:protein-disulfide isomerase
MALRQKIETATSAVIALCALAITVSVVRGQFFPPTRQPDGLLPEREQAWRQYAVGDMRIGPTTAPVTITAFSDFECPACYRLYRALTGIRTRHAGEVAIVYRNYPLDDLHPFARPAAVAAECAAAQGRFAAYHDFLFEHQDSLKHIAWTSLAGRLGISDTTAFAACLGAPETATKLRRDSTDAIALKIPGTPLVLVNGWLYRGAPTSRVLDSVITLELAETRR